MIRYAVTGALLGVLAFTALVLSSLFVDPAEARGLHPRCNIDWPCAAAAVSKSAVVRNFRTTQGTDLTQQFGLMRENPVIKRRIARADRFRNVEFGSPIYPPETAQSFLSGRQSGLVAPLAAKLASIQAACPGTVAISGVRHTYIAGTHRISLHASGKAVDVRGPYGCIYAQLRGWNGGYSTDASRMRHIHISYDADGGREMGLAFRHGGHRHARRSHHRYASAP